MSQDQLSIQKKTINFRGKLMELSGPKVMGILNVTPDSFYDGGLYESVDNAVERARQMIREGADIIDIGGVSTRPGSQGLSVEDELIRVMPVIQSVRKEFPEAIISIDTYQSEVARVAIEAGVDLVNDISGGNLDPKMLEVVAELNVPYVLMHIRGEPSTMQQSPTYQDVISDVAWYFSERIVRLKRMGVKDIILDPGFGFGKTQVHNLKLLGQLEFFERVFGFPVLVGLSRKSMIEKIAGVSRADTLPGTMVLNTISMLNGASLLRVHDVKETVQAVKLFMAYHSIR